MSQLKQINDTVVTKDVVSVLSVFIHLYSSFTVCVISFANNLLRWSMSFTTLESCWVYHCGDPLPGPLFTFTAIETSDIAISVQVQASGGSPHHHGNTWEKRRGKWRETGWMFRGDGDSNMCLTGANDLWQRSQRRDAIRKGELLVDFSLSHLFPVVLVIHAELLWSHGVFYWLEWYVSLLMFISVNQFWLTFSKILWNPVYILR